MSWAWCLNRLLISCDDRWLILTDRATSRYLGMFCRDLEMSCRDLEMSCRDLEMSCGDLEMSCRDLEMSCVRNGVAGECRTLIRCVRFLQEIELLQSSPCRLSGSRGARGGVCCPHTLLASPPQSEAQSEQAKSCPRNIICIPPPRNVTIPNIRKT